MYVAVSSIHKCFDILFRREGVSGSMEHVAGVLASSTASELFRLFCRPSVPASDSDISKLARLLEISKRQLDLDLQQLVKDAHGRPVLLSYASDGTPGQSTTRQTFSASGLPTVTRGGRRIF